MKESDTHNQTGEAKARLFHDETAQLPSWLTNALLVLVALAVFSMMALVFANVFGRYVLSAPIAGAEEVIKFLMALTIFGAFPVVTQRSGHIIVSIFDEFFRGRGRFIQQLFIMIVSVLCIIAIGWLMLQQGATMTEEIQVTDYLEWPFAPITYVMAALAFLTAIVQLAMIVYLIRTGHPPKATQLSKG
jgi:TRAP-type C4-dicarboxylate transport system permease small subunit